MIFLPMIKKQQEEYKKKFRESGATSKETALTLEEIGIVKTQSLRNLIWRGEITQLSNGRYFINN